MNEFMAGSIAYGSGRTRLSEVVPREVQVSRDDAANTAPVVLRERLIKHGVVVPSYSAVDGKMLKFWSGRPGSNRRRPAWEAGILPLNYSRNPLLSMTSEYSIRPEHYLSTIVPANSPIR